MHTTLGKRAKARTALLTLIACGALACHLKTPPVPVDCTPLDPTNQASLPAMLADGGYPQTINVTGGSASGYTWADGQGYILAPIEKVWAALQMPGVVADRSQLQSVSISKSDVDTACDWSFIMVNVTDATNLGLPYYVEWRGIHTAGTASAPTAANICGDLTQSAQVGGEDVMSILSDSIVITEVAPNVTAYAAIRHRGPLDNTVMNCEDFVQDVYNNVIDTLNNQPLTAFGS